MYVYRDSVTLIYTYIYIYIARNEIGWVGRPGNYLHGGACNRDLGAPTFRCSRVAAIAARNFDARRASLALYELRVSRARDSFRRESYASTLHPSVRRYVSWRSLTVIRLAAQVRYFTARLADLSSLRERAMRSDDARITISLASSRCAGFAARSIESERSDLT